MRKRRLLFVENWKDFKKCKFLDKSFQLKDLKSVYDDVLCYTFGFLSIKELLNVSMVCKKWKFIALQSRRVFVLQPWKSKEEENIKIYNIQALQLICQHKVDQAITLLSKILEFYPNSIKVFLYRAKAYQQKKEI